MNDRYRIIGEQRPIVGIPYTYELNIPVKSVRWEVRIGLNVISSKPQGVFNFQNKSLGKEFLVCAYYNNSPELGAMAERCVRLNVKPLPGSPGFVLMEWRDANLNRIKGNMKYLDDIYLLIQTKNIPPGETLAVKLFEKELLSENRKAGDTMFTPVDEVGIAKLKVSAALLKKFAEKFNKEDFYNDSVHEYYAEITYFGAEVPIENQPILHQAGQKIKSLVKATEKTELIYIDNVAGQAIPSKNAQKAAVVQDEQVMEKRTPVKLKLDVYFDGTMGNKWNVELRNKEKRTLEEQKILDKYAKNTKDETSSYNQCYTSITDLYDLDKSEVDAREVKIYIEGVGSQKHGEDITIRGAALGWDMGGAGIRSKIARAMAGIVSNVTNDRIIDQNKNYISELKVSVIGFSRGATTSRSFVSRKAEIALNALTAEDNVIFKFLGLFDTVSSVTDGKDDVKTYDLKVGGSVEKVLQLSAGNEYRKKFSLTDISSSIDAGVGYQLELPGDHSDIGGGHKDFCIETEKDMYGDKVEIRKEGLKEEVKNDAVLINRLIEEGWYDEKDRKAEKKIISIPISSLGGHYSQEVTAYTATRYIRNHYRYIPLGIMIDFAKKYGEIKFDENKQREEYDVNVVKPLSPQLIALKSSLHSYALSNDGAQSVSAMHLLFGEVQRHIRRNYLHLSAMREGGKNSFTDWLANKGRYDKQGKPQRKIIEG